MYYFQVDSDVNINYILLHSDASSAFRNVQTCTNRSCIISEVGFQFRRNFRSGVAYKKCIMQNYILLCQRVFAFIYPPH